MSMRESRVENFTTKTIERFLDSAGRQGLLSEEEYDAICQLVYSEKSVEVEEGIGLLQGILGEKAIDPCSIRTTCYPTSFSAAVIAWKATQVAAQGNCCPQCGEQYGGEDHDATIDHDSPVSDHWNTTGYKSDRATRHTFYNDTSNLQVMCRSCNSSKNGTYYTKVPAYGGGFSL